MHKFIWQITLFHNFLSQRPLNGLQSYLLCLAKHGILFLSLTTRHFTFAETAFSFLDIPDLAAPKLFWIKELRVRSSEDLPPNQPPVLHDVIITRNIPTYESLAYKSSNLIYFTDASGTTRCIPCNGEEIYRGTDTLKKRSSSRSFSRSFLILKKHS